jgi:hypothetical protein
MIIILLVFVISIIFVVYKSKSKKLFIIK